MLQMSEHNLGGNECKSTPLVSVQSSWILYPRPHSLKMTKVSYEIPNSKRRESRDTITPVQSFQTFRVQSITSIINLIQCLLYLYTSISNDPQ